jgi:putative phosphoribosyl transferase
MQTTESIPFRDRADAGRRLGKELSTRTLRNPIVLAIPRGGVATGAAVARVLGVELDVVLSRKLRAPFQPEYAIGAISEDGKVTLNPETRRLPDLSQDYLEREIQYQIAEIDRRKQLIRAVRPQAQIEGRSVIVTDDGIATGSTAIAALQSVRTRNPHELILAVPVAAAERLNDVQHYCDEIVCLLIPEDFEAVGQFYMEFDAVEDEEVVRLLRDFVPTV